jgi:LmbE family N-acetylglucosaminyl deacetylase
MSSTLDGHELGTVLGIWAHPDDESYLSAMLMARARAAGQRVVVVTATDGEHGAPDPVRWPPPRLRHLRRRELRRALAALGVLEHHFLGFPDGRCAQVPSDVAISAIAAHVERVQPDTIVTFGPEGMTGHPDHRAVSRWVGAAHRSTGSRARILHATVTPAFHRTWGAVNRRIDLWSADVAPPCTPESEAKVLVGSEIEVDRKLRAIRAHASQTTELERQLGLPTFRRWWATEWFAEHVPDQAGARC